MLTPVDEGLFDIISGKSYFNWTWFGIHDRFSIDKELHKKDGIWTESGRILQHTVYRHLNKKQEGRKACLWNSLQFL